MGNLVDELQVWLDPGTQTLASFFLTFSLHFPGLDSSYLCVLTFSSPPPHRRAVFITYTLGKSSRKRHFSQSHIEGFLAWRACPPPGHVMGRHSAFHHNHLCTQRNNNNNTTESKCERRTRRDMSPKKFYEWTRSPRKDAPCHESSGKGTSIPR